jgi:hypothetical protein
MALKAPLPYMKGVELTGLVGMIDVLDAIVRTLLILVMGSIFATPSLALFLPQFDPQNPVHGLLAAINIMTLWGLVVLAVGLARLSGRGFGKAAFCVFGIWLFFLAIRMGFAFGMQALSSR